jgi:hypothetical protein
MVFQIGLWPTMTVAQNVMLALVVAIVGRERCRRSTSAGSTGSRIGIRLAVGGSSGASRWRAIAEEPRFLLSTTLLRTRPVHEAGTPGRHREAGRRA